MAEPEDPAAIRVAGGSGANGAGGSKGQSCIPRVARPRQGVLIIPGRGSKEGEERRQGVGGGQGAGGSLALARYGHPRPPLPVAWSQSVDSKGS